MPSMQPGISYFYPRPPRGGRRPMRQSGLGGTRDFYPRPPRGGRPATWLNGRRWEDISTHALREEGDAAIHNTEALPNGFLPTPSARRATYVVRRHPRGREYFYPRPPRGGRQALRQCCSNFRSYFYPRPPRGGRPRPKSPGRTAFADFYPRPPRGGRLPAGCYCQKDQADFYPRPPRGGRPSKDWTRSKGGKISTHALREEGDKSKV